MTETTQARFKLGDRVRVQDRETLFHTRTQGYTRNKVGVIVNVRPKWVIPEDEAWGKWQENKGRVEQFYIVRFQMLELWAPDYGGSPIDSLETEMYDSWLEPVDD
ncbi:MAG: nitrile hydratase subunit beta [Laribacter sp.]|nr:nitrile hydratase subunit beta [Laribacter sp.]MBP9527527.1 nitrile hydratase subunit beta [Laribacter sp.]MBP9608588.1 nitrile hydratase subunit beta [Laribacter sp.]